LLGPITTASTAFLKETKAKYKELATIYSSMYSKLNNNWKKVFFNNEERRTIDDLFLALEKIHFDTKTANAIKRYKDLIKFILDISELDIYSLYILGDFDDAINTKHKLESAIGYSIIETSRFDENNYYITIFNDKLKAYFKDVMLSKCIQSYYLVYEDYKEEDIVTEKTIEQYLDSIKFVPMIRCIAGQTFSSLNVYINSNPLYPETDIYLDIHEIIVNIAFPGKHRIIIINY
jgi:hypothetical protein